MSEGRLTYFQDGRARTRHEIHDIEVLEHAPNTGLVESVEGNIGIHTEAILSNPHIKSREETIPVSVNTNADRRPAAHQKNHAKTPSSQST